MDTRKIGSLSVSVIGVGCNNFGGRIDYPATLAVVDAALEAGINFFDTADVYGATKSEEFLGRALGTRRKDVIIASKFGIPVEGQGQGASPAYIRLAAEASLRRLGTDYIDLYQLHRPDDSVPIADTLGALNDLVQVGKVRAIGCSNFSVAQLREGESAVKPGAARFVSVQNEYSLFNRAPESDGVLDECARTQVGFLPYFPLASGLLTGKYRKGQPMPTGTRLAGARGNEVLTAHNLDRVEALITYAEAHGHTLLDLAMSWLLAKPVISSVIAGATQPAQIRANAAASNWSLTDADLSAIDAIVGQPATV